MSLNEKQLLYEPMTLPYETLEKIIIIIMVVSLWTARDVKGFSKANDLWSSVCRSLVSFKAKKVTSEQVNKTKERMRNKHKAQKIIKRKICNAKFIEMTNQLTSFFICYDFLNKII